MTLPSDLDTLKMVRVELYDAHDKLWHLAKDKETNPWVKGTKTALTALDAIIARMEQNTGTSGIAGDASPRKDEGTAKSEFSTSPAPYAAGKPERPGLEPSDSGDLRSEQLEKVCNTAPAAPSKAIDEKWLENISIFCGVPIHQCKAVIGGYESAKSATPIVDVEALEKELVG